MRFVIIVAAGLENQDDIRRNAGGIMKTLIVDDEREYRTLLTNVLKTAGIDVVAAENGKDAIEKLRESAFDMVITDLYMPIMDGIVFHRTVRAMPDYASVPFLFVSGFDDSYTRSAIKNPRIEGFLQKASPVQLLLDWIKYLTTPEDRRPRMLPGSDRSTTSLRSAGASRTSTRIFTF
jgi:two-component system, chemotaxis family, chemotaxis protein CheY